MFCSLGLAFAFHKNDREKTENLDFQETPCVQRTLWAPMRLYRQNKRARMMQLRAGIALGGDFLFVFLSNGSFEEQHVERNTNGKSILSAHILHFSSGRHRVALADRPFPLGQKHGSSGLSASVTNATT